MSNAARASGERRPSGSPRRVRKGRAPIDTSGGRPTTTSRFEEACWLVEVSGLVPVLEERIDWPKGRPRSLSIKGLLVAMCLNGRGRFHQGHVAEIARTLNALLPWQLRALRVANWDPVEAYDRTDRLFNKLSGELDAGWTASVGGAATKIDHTWFAKSLVQASLMDVPVSSRTRAIDGTDVETWAGLQGDHESIELDGPAEDAPDPDDRSERTPRKNRRRNRARILGVGDDGRKIYTVDLDARAGWRSATNSRAAGPFVGFEWHLVVQAPDVKSSDGIVKVGFGPAVPPVVTDFSLTPAGSHRADAIVPSLIAAKRAGEDIGEIVWDRGYSQLRPESTSYPLARAGIEQTFQPMNHQRGIRPFSSDAILLDGHIFSVHLPEDLQVALPMPPLGATEVERERYEAPFNARARYRWQRHAGPDNDGVTRWRCPFHAGFLRSRSLPSTMRRVRKAPLVNLPPGDRCCEGTLSVPASKLPHWQRLTPGTTAWRKSYGRREAVEGLNGMLKGGFVNVERKFLRVLGLTKITICLAFTIVGYNRDRIRSFGAREAAKKGAAHQPRRRAKRRSGRWKDLLEGTSEQSSRDPRQSPQRTKPLGATRKALMEGTPEQSGPDPPRSQE